MSTHALLYKACREASHTLLQQNKTKHRQHQHGFLVCNQGIRPCMYTLYDNDCDVRPSGILCTRVSIPRDTRYGLVPSFEKHVWSHDTLHMEHRGRADCWDICQWKMFHILRQRFVHDCFENQIDILHRWDHVSNIRN